MLISKPAGKIKVRLATDITEPVALHWALSRKMAGEWLVRILTLLERDMNVS